jgi:hypothetical protein
MEGKLPSLIAVAFAFDTNISLKIKELGIISVSNPSDQRYIMNVSPPACSFLLLYSQHIRCSSASPECKSV